MSYLLKNYFKILSICGFVFLFILACMAFANYYCLEIKEDKHISSGVMLITNSIIYLIIAIGLIIHEKRTNKRNGYQYNSLFYILIVIEDKIRI